jgi:pimeloyl-ACP methyl ester carboxylesterase
MKAIVRAYYGRKPAFSYFSGVSDGGHEALVLAQRYPADFDGVIAGAPANSWAPLVGLVAPWVAAANQNSAGSTMRLTLTSARLPPMAASSSSIIAGRIRRFRPSRASTITGPS